MKFNEWQTRVVNMIVEESNKEYFEVINALKRLHRYAATLHRLDENSCNGYPRQTTEIRDGKIYRFNVEDIKWRARDEKKEESIQKLAEKLSLEMGWSFERQDDPRGFPFYIKMKAKDGKEIEVSAVL